MLGSSVNAEGSDGDIEKVPVIGPPVFVITVVAIESPIVIDWSPPVVIVRIGGPI